MWLGLVLGLVGGELLCVYMETEKERKWLAAMLRIFVCVAFPGVPLHAWSQIVVVYRNQLRIEMGTSADKWAERWRLKGKQTCAWSFSPTLPLSPSNIKSFLRGYFIFREVLMKSQEETKLPSLLLKGYILHYGRGRNHFTYSHPEQLIVKPNMSIFTLRKHF